MNAGLATYGLTTNHPLSTALGTELLINGDFESWDDPTTPSYWTKQAYGSATVNEESTTVHGGTRSARFVEDGTGISVSQNLSPALNTRYRTSIWIYSSGAVNARLTIRIRDRFSVYYYLQSNGLFKRSTDLGYSSQYAVNASSNGAWKQFNIEFRTLPDIFNNGMDCILAFASGTVYIDDFSVKELIPGVQPGTQAFWQPGSRTRIFNALRSKIGETTPTQSGETGGLRPIQPLTYSGAANGSDLAGWRLDGTNDYITNLGPSPTSAVSYSVWARREAGGGTYQNVLHLGDHAAIYGTLCLRGASDAPEVSLGGNNRREWSATTPRTTTDGKWHHFVFVIPSALQAALSTSVLYVDGQVQTPGTTDVTSIQASRTTLSIGKSGISYCSAHIALPLLFSRVVSAAEALNLFNASKHMFYPR